MDTREVHARHAFEALERIAADTAHRIGSNTKVSAAGLRDQPRLSMAPRFSGNRNECIGEAAYFIAMRRGFSPGHELEDWLAAENEVGRLIGESCAC